MAQDIILRNLTNPPTPGASTPIIGTRTDLRGGVRGGDGGGDPTPDGLYDLSNIQYLGAFKLDNRDGAIGGNFNEGRIGFSPPNGSNGSWGSLFVDGGTGTTTISLAEYQIPNVLSDPTENNPANLTKATILQPYIDFSAISNGLNYTLVKEKIGAIVVENGRLFVCAFKYYGGTENTDHVFVFNDVNDISGGTNSGQWISLGTNTFDRNNVYAAPIPSEYQSTFGASWSTGATSGNMAVLGRTSSGPALYASDFANYSPGNTLIPSNPYLSYPEDKPIHLPEYPDPDPEFTSGYAGDYHNQATMNHYLSQLGITTLQGYEDWVLSDPRTEWNTLDFRPDNIVNDLWVEFCRVGFAFIVPGTKTYLCIGNLGGRRYGGLYAGFYDGKPITFDKTRTGGPATCDASDKDQYFWAFNVDDITSATETFSPKPYDRGVFQNNRWRIDMGQWKRPTGLISSGAFDSANRRLYVAHRQAHTAGTNEYNTIVSVYQI